MKTNIILATVMFLGFLSRPELVISYLPPGMASKINTKGKRLCISFLYFGVLKHAESLADMCVWQGVGWGGFFFFFFEIFKVFHLIPAPTPTPEVNISLAVSYCSHPSFMCPQLC